MRPALLPTLIALLLSAPAAHAEFSVGASAWGYGGSDTQTTPPSPSAHWHGVGPDFPGYTDNTSHSKFAYLDGASTMFGCGSNAPFQQVCNQGGTGGDWHDIVTVSASAPAGTLLTVRVTLELDGTIQGIGGYSYTTYGALRDQLRSIGGTTGGTVQHVEGGMSISDTRTWDQNLLVGDRYDISGHLDTQVFNRICAGGSSDCTPSVTEWTMTLNAASKLSVVQLTSVPGFHLIGDGGHDFVDTPTAVAPGDARGNGLRVTSANPSSGPVDLALQLSKASNLDVAVFDVSGRRLATLTSGAQPAGTRTLTWDGRDLAGRLVRGMCFVRARGEAFTAQRQVVMLR